MSYPPPTLRPLSVSARRLRVAERWLRAEADAGRIPHLRAGDRYLADPDAVERSLLRRARRDPRQEVRDAD